MTGVMGFLAQCEICPQKAILTDQPDGWVCPRCVEVTAPAFVKRGECGVPGCTTDHGPYVDQVADVVKLGVADVPYAGPYVQPGDRVAVEMPDGTLRTGPYNTDSLASDEGADTLERGLRTIASVVAFAEQMTGNPYGVGGFGDVDVAAADPIPEPLPLTIPIDDPLATAIVAEVGRNPNRPMITALVAGRTFVFGGYTQTSGEPLSTVWIDEEKLRLSARSEFTHYPWGAAIPEEELPYRPAVKHHAYRAPVDDDEPDLGSIRG